jgi:hypothetical protein
MPFPPFSDYEPTFSSPLPPMIFALFNPPPWLPSPQQLVRIARVVYPYWKERRLERKGHRISPVLNVSSRTISLPKSLSYRDFSSMRKTLLTSPTSVSADWKPKPSGKLAFNKYPIQTNSSSSSPSLLRDWIWQKPCCFVNKRKWRT